MPRHLPPISVLVSLFECDPEAGTLRWKFREGPPRKVAAHNARFAGKIAGAIQERGTNTYLAVELDGKPRYAHRVIYKMITGREPEQIDHINGDGTDNRICNLRECNNRQNQGNRQRRRRANGLPKGVGYKDGKYRAFISKKGRYVHLGIYDTPEAARSAYLKAAKEYFGEFAGQ